MSKRVLVVNGHPDPRPERFCAALCDAYASGARAGGRTVDRVDVGSLDFAPPGEGIPPKVASALDKIRKADSLTIIFPLWLDGPPLSLRELFQLYAEGDDEKPARIITTMDLPAFIQRHHANGMQATLPGVQKSEPLYIGNLQYLAKAQRDAWLERVKLLGTHDE